MSHDIPARARFALRSLLPLILVAAAGCSTLLAVDDQQKLLDSNAVLGGTVRTDGFEATGPLIVGVADRGPDGFRLVDHFVAERAGSWVLSVAPGTYWVVAFEDADGDGHYDDEPAYRPDEANSITVGPGQHLIDLSVVIPKNGRFLNKRFSIEDAVLRGREQQQGYSLFAMSRVGDVVSLDDPRFAEEVAVSGMWRPYDFLLHAQPGIYLLEPWDPKRIPVLFVHGMGGTPINFRELIAGLDHSRYQALVAYYPTGGKLDNLSRWLAQIYVRLRTRYRFDRAAVVAHSMGGLVSRGFLLDDWDANGNDGVRRFVTISSPFGGMPSAGAGVEDSPIIVRSWYGLAPGSDFLDGLFYSDLPARKKRRTLPPTMTWDMLFGYRGGSGTDGVVPLASVLRMECQQEARSLRGYDENHTSILRSPLVAARLNEVLAGMD